MSDAQASVSKSAFKNSTDLKKHFDFNDTIEFNVSNLPRGKYYLIIEFLNGKKFQEIIILN